MMHSIPKVIFILIIGLAIMDGLTNDLSAQNYRIRGILTDRQTREPVASAHITFKGSTEGTISDLKGYFSLEIKDLPAGLIVIHVAYDTLRIPLNAAFYRNELESRVPVWLMDRASYDIPEARISAYALKVFGSDTHYITDYEFLGNRIILLGFRNNNILRPELFVSDLSGSILHVQPFPGAKELVTDCFGNTHLLTGLDCCQLSVAGDSCSVRNRISIDEWENLMKPALIFLGRSVVWEMADENRFWIGYQLLSAESQTARTFFSAGYRPDASMAKALDNQLTFLYRAIGEFRAPEWSPGPLHNPVHDIIPDIEFSRRIELKTVYSPVFLSKRKLVVFNFPDNRIEIFNFFGDSIASVPIGQHNSPYWNKRVIQDGITEKFYFEIKSGQNYSLEEVDFLTGQTIRNIPVINYPKIDHLRINNGEVYFLYENLFGVKEKTLYRLRK